MGPRRKALIFSGEVNSMKKAVLRISLAGLALGFSLILVAQNIQYETGTINVEIPVRVFRGDAFIDNLKIDDFEVYEDGKLQALDAVYLIKKSNIERQEENKKFTPETSRHFYLFFDLTDYDPRVRTALEYFVKEVLLPGDDLIIVTPLKSYRMKTETFTIIGRDKIFDQLMGLLRRDIQIGTAEYRGTIEDLKGLALSISTSFPQKDQTIVEATQIGDAFSMAASVYRDEAPIEQKLQQYSEALMKLENLRVVEEEKLTNFADYLKDQPGQKEVFLFYQREFIPQIDPKLLGLYMTTFNDRPDIVQSISGLFEFFRRETPIDVDFVKRAYSDSSAAIHFLFLSKPPPRIPGLYMAEQSDDIFAPFMEMSQATGGFSSVSANAEAIMKTAVAASENYYLLYYTPRNYKSDGQFRNIEVRVKSGNYRISHRLGYIAD
jgi:hypothetical protein